MFVVRGKDRIKIKIDMFQLYDQIFSLISLIWPWCCLLCSWFEEKSVFTDIFYRNGQLMLYSLIWNTHFFFVFTRTLGDVHKHAVHIIPCALQIFTKQNVHWACSWSTSISPPAHFWPSPNPGSCYVIPPDILPMQPKGVRNWDMNFLPLGK